MQILLSGNMLLQKAFLQSPCFKQRLSAPAIDTSKQHGVALRTGAYLSLHDHDRHLRFPSATIRVFAQFRFPSILCLTVNKFIVGIALARSPYFLMYLQYC